MSGNYKFSMDQKNITRFLNGTIGSFVQDRLINKEQRLQHKEQCAERLAAEDGSCHRGSEVRYSDQAVLANLDWGMDALEEAINTSNVEAKFARLEHAERMLQVCAMLNSKRKTAGVPNFYLSAWSHLNLAYLWTLRNNLHNSVLHILDMFMIDPFFSRIDFAPELWKALFLPHMSSIVGWYSEARHRLVMEVIPDSVDLSFTADFDQFFNESLVFSMRPDQAEKIQKLEQLYGKSLDENTRLYAKYYKDCISSDSATSKKVIPMVPIAEPPMTPLHEVSRSIPDYVKFGPILPKSAGFSPFLKGNEGETCGLNNTTSSPTLKQDGSATRTPKEDSLVHDEDEFTSECFDSYMDSEVKSPLQGTSNSSRKVNNEGSGVKVEQLRTKEQTHSPVVFSAIDSPKTPSPKFFSPKKTANSRKNSEPFIFSPIDSPKTPSPKFSSPKQTANSRKDSEPLLRLLSSRLTNPTSSTSLPLSPQLRNDSSPSPSPSPTRSDCEIIERPKSCRTNLFSRRSMSIGNISTQIEGISSLSEIEEDGSQSCHSISSSSGKMTPSNRPPKDYICPITGQLLNDPVTLETGQTYESRAIQEWLQRGHTTCPITRQPLSTNLLPKTNYVLKRLITSWKEQCPDLAQEYSYAETPRSCITPTSSREQKLDSSPLMERSRPAPQTVDNYAHKKGNRFVRPTVSTSPTSVISQAAVEAVINGLKSYTSCLCTSENLQECESAVLTIARTWKESKGDHGVHSYLSKPTIVNGFAEILLASVNREVLRTSVYVLSELVFVDESVGETLTSVDSDFDCLAALLKNGLAEAVILIYQLRPTYAQLFVHSFIPSLVQVIQSRDEELDDLQFVMHPKDAAIALLEQILVGGDEDSRSQNALSVISGNGLPSLIKCLDRLEGRQAVVSILLSCMRADRSCKNLIADRAQLPLVLELFHAGNDTVRGSCIDFLSELVCLNRRTFCNQILQIIKDGGTFSTMHAFLVYLQMAPMEQQPAIASLLLQLDLLVEPRKMSIYREEAIETLIEALRRKDFPMSQVMALDAFASLCGRLTASGKSLTDAWLLKTAGHDQPYNSLLQAERLKVPEEEPTETMEEEEKAAHSWEKKVAFVLCNHENGSIFQALEECLKSNSLEVEKSCFFIATWLTHMLTNLPETGVRDTARRCLLDHFINVLLSSRNFEEKVLATVALKSFINDHDALKELGKYAKSICKSLRKLKRSSVMVTDVLKALMSLSSVNAVELWSCAEVTEIDSCSNGEVLALVHLKDRVVSSHSDGTIKVWDAGKRVLKLIQEVREHTKAVTCLYIPSSGDKLYSGSLDKTIRVWAITSVEIHCTQVHDVKDMVLELVANTSFACFVSQGTGVKVYNWSGVPKHINFNKHVKCLAMGDEKLFCGCTGYIIQEVDLSKWTSSIFFAGTKKLLGKHTFHALYVCGGFLFAGGSSVDGTAGKVVSLSTKAVIGSLPTGFDIHCISINNDFIFAGTKCGIIEVYLRERLVRVASIRMGGGGNAKVSTLASDSAGEMLFAGSSDGKIQAWTLD